MSTEIDLMVDAMAESSLEAWLDGHGIGHGLPVPDLSAEELDRATRALADELGLRLSQNPRLALLGALWSIQSQRNESAKTPANIAPVTVPVESGER